jgi:hypothetical protein
MDSRWRYIFDDLNCNFARFYHDNVGQSFVLSFVRRYIVVYHRIVGRQSASTAIFLSFFGTMKLFDLHE